MVVAWKIACTWFPNRSVIAGPPPLYNATVKSTPVSSLNTKARMCGGVPVGAANANFGLALT